MKNADTYDTAIKLECLYVAETLVLNRRIQIKSNTEKGNCQQNIRPNQQLTLSHKHTVFIVIIYSIIEEYTDTQSDMKTPRKKFYGHINRIQPSRQQKVILKLYEAQRNEKVETRK